MEGFLNSQDFIDNYYAANNWQTTLAQELSNVATVVYLTSVTGLPPKGVVSINSEHIFYDYIDTVAKTLGNVSNPVTREVDGSTAATHAAGSTVQHRINALTFNALMQSVQKRKTFQLTLAQTSAAAISEQNITGFAGRARITDMRIIATGGSSDFIIELYNKDAFKGEQRLFRSVSLESVETTTDGSTTGATVPVTATDGFLVDSLAVVGSPFGGTYEYIRIDDIESGVSLAAMDNLVESFSAGAAVVQVLQVQDEINYEDRDYLENGGATKELHIRVINNDPLSPVTIKLDIVAEVTDETVS